MFTRQQIIDFIQKLVGEKTDDETLETLKNLMDWINSVFENGVGDLEKIKSEYDEKIKKLEAEWRKKYRDAFFNGVDIEKDDLPKDDVDEKIEIAELFEG